MKENELKENRGVNDRKKKLEKKERVKFLKKNTKKNHQTKKI